jgi:hypothetical protein
VTLFGRFISATAPSTEERSSQRQLRGLPPVFCWGLQPSHQLGQSCTASMLSIRWVALLGPASCSGLVRWHAPRSGTMPAAMQTAASIALGSGGKALVCGSQPWRGRRQARFVTRLHFCHQQFFCSRRTEACLWHFSDVPGRLRSWGKSGSGLPTAKMTRLTQKRLGLDINTIKRNAS